MSFQCYHLQYFKRKREMGEIHCWHTLGGGGGCLWGWIVASLDKPDACCYADHGEGTGRRGGWRLVLEPPPFWLGWGDGQDLLKRSEREASV